MSIKKIKDDIDDIKKSTGKNNNAFWVLEDIKKGKLTAEEGLEILDKHKLPFTSMVRVIINSALKHGKLS